MDKAQRKHLSVIVNSLCVSLALIMVIGGCSPLYLVNTISTENDFITVSDERYGNEQRHQLDIYVPERTAPGSPVVVFFYGGSWKRGEKANYAFVGRTLSSKGFITVIPDYRLYPEVTFPAFVEDGAKVLAWVSEHIEQARNGIVVMGHSAGAHIAALLALDKSYLEASRTTAQHYQRDDRSGRTLRIRPHAVQEHSANICRGRVHRKDHACYVCLLGKVTAPLTTRFGRQYRHSRKLERAQTSCSRMFWKCNVCRARRYWAFLYFTWAIQFIFSRR